jgi:polysaccharide biosynthesis/export protein ExoF
MVVDSEREEIRTEMLKVRERIADAEASIKQLREPGGSELLAEINGLDGDIESATRKLDTVEDLIRQLHLDGAVDSVYDEQIEIRYSILREQDGQLIEETTAETSPVRPGDVIKISRRITRPAPNQTSRGDLAVIGSQ